MEMSMISRYVTAPEFRESVEDLENILIYNNEGKGIRIRDLGKVVERMTPPTIERKDRERVITVSAVAGKGAALSDLVAAARNELKQMDIPSDVSWQLGGTFEDQQDTFTDLGILMVLIIILVFIVMAAQFESLVDPFVIMFSIPFAFTGIVLGLAVTQTPLGVMALIGVIMLMGIVVKNGIVLIDYTILCRERGMGIITSVVTAGKSRLRPVLMTTLTTVLGMIPDGGGNRRGFRDVALDGYDRGLGSFRIHLDYLDYCSDGLCRIRRQRRKTKTPQNKKGYEIINYLCVP